MESGYNFGWGECASKCFFWSQLTLQKPKGFRAKTHTEAYIIRRMIPPGEGVKSNVRLAEQHRIWSPPAFRVVSRQATFGVRFKPTAQQHTQDPVHLTSPGWAHRSLHPNLWPRSTHPASGSVPLYWWNALLKFLLSAVRSKAFQAGCHQPG